jgi:hypothetical protein
MRMAATWPASCSTHDGGQQQRLLPAQEIPEAQERHEPHDDAVVGEGGEAALRAGFLLAMALGQLGAPAQAGRIGDPLAKRAHRQLVEERKRRALRRVREPHAHQAVVAELGRQRQRVRHRLGDHHALPLVALELARHDARPFMAIDGNAGQEQPVALGQRLAHEFGDRRPLEHHAIGGAEPPDGGAGRVDQHRELRPQPLAPTQAVEEAAQGIEGDPRQIDRQSQQHQHVGSAARREGAPQPLAGEIECSVTAMFELASARRRRCRLT